MPVLAKRKLSREVEEESERANGEGSKFLVERGRRLGDRHDLLHVCTKWMTLHKQCMFKHLINRNLHVHIHCLIKSHSILPILPASYPVMALKYIM